MHYVPCVFIGLMKEVMTGYYYIAYFTMMYVSGCSKQMDVVFILDFSGSMGQTFNIVMAFAEEVTMWSWHLLKK